MKKRRKLFTTGLVAASIIAPTSIYANNETTENIKIELEKRSVVLGNESKIRVSFKEKFDAETITVNYLCYDQELSKNLKYNSQTQSYEGTIKFNIDPEYLNVWKINNIVINDNQNKQVLNTDELEKLGLKLDDYNITQEYIVSNMAQIRTYMQKTSAPVVELSGDSAYDNAVKVSKEGWKTTTDKVVIINGDIVADGITATPLASTYDAPILIVKKDSVPAVIKEEIKRLSPKEIVIVGGENSVSSQVANELKSINSASVNRIWGQSRYETSLEIAKAIDSNHDVNKVYMANGFQGDIDALSIAAKAGEDKQPVILTEKYKVPTNSYNWLKSEALKDVYFIGGPNTLATDVIDQMADIVSKPPSGSVYYNRVYGADRHETNAKVMAKFYPQSELESVIVARSDELTDALVAGPLAAKLNSPILITSPSYLSDYHTDNLEKKSANKVYQIGKAFKDGIISEIAYKLSLHNLGGKTVLIDPGHGGTDSGALNKVNPSIKEKDYTLDTSLATAEYLRNSGINVVLTRQTDKTLSLTERSSMSNALNPDLFVSVHFNSYNGTAKGTEVYYKYADRNGGTSKTLATNILNSILSEFNFSNRGIKTRTLDSGKDYYHVIREVKAPSVIVESSFIDSEQDQLLVNTIEKRNHLGTQIGKGIEKTLR
ncbi:N-acetylmuramoyl-L-alanine amidase [Romboutsia lituseburensis]|uniref:N-acetylmuramoyl-L-alanine amidase n=1 Tax=Romboutsia lituseburensis TaxID=1537 RepID=UPI0022EB8833|nr:N-acetylmuramoyl-L-alanine amidase [Romboutsia lituseburensis]